MEIIQNLRSFFGASDIERQVIENEVRKDNFRRVIYVLTGSVVMNIFLILHFRSSAAAGSSIEVTWKENIIFLHSIMLVLNVLLVAAAIYIRNSKKEFRRFSAFIFYFVYLLLPLLGAVAVSIDQLVTPSIMAFFITCIACALAFVVRPLVSLLLFSATFLAFYTGISITQTNPDLLLTNIANGFGAVALSFGISVLLFRNNIIRYTQSRQIEEQKRQLEENYNNLLKTSEELTEANSTKDKFFSIIAHDLRGPVTSTINLTELIIENRDRGNRDEDELMLNMLHDSLQNTSKLLSNLLIWAKAQTNNVDIKPITINLWQNVEDNIDLLYSLATEKNIVIRNNVGKEIFVEADMEMVNTIIRNLISNAIKFTNEFGNILIAATYIEPLNGERQQVEICVEDNGVGMEQAKLDSLFRIDKKTTTYGTHREAGTGLGLILCKEFIEKNHGTIKVKSQPGKGSCFTFTLPAAV